MLAGLACSIHLDEDRMIKLERALMPPLQGQTDPSSDLSGLVRAASERVPILSCDLHLGESSKPGLQAFAKGFVKEGVGAGGASIVAITKSRGKITGKKLMKAIEKEYEVSI